MKTLKRGFTKRALSMLLTLLMMLSICTVGIVSTSAASVDLAENGTSVNTIYLNTGGSTMWDQGGAWFVAWVWKTGGSGWSITGVEAEDGIYSFTDTNSFENVIFIRMTDSATSFSWDDNDCYWNRTQGDLAIGSKNCYKITAWGSDKNCSGQWEDYDGASAFIGSYFADVDGDITTTDDVIYTQDGKLYLPSAEVTLFTTEGTLTIGDYTVTSTGTKVDLSTGTYNLGTDFSGSVKVFRSANVSSIHTTTIEPVPQGKGYNTDKAEGIHKDDYETKGTILAFDENGTRMNTKDNVLKKIKGRGNSSWLASSRIIGKYAFNITLESKAKLLDESEKSKKFCLVSYNADEARMRNAVVYELAQQIGVNFVPDYEPVDFYNNGMYVGSYLLTDKVEIGNPLVDIVELDEINEELNSTFDDDGNVIVEGTNYGIYDAKPEVLETYRRYVNGSKSTNTTKGFYKYVALEEPNASLYADSGFLLEFELHERFADEISGFISNQGQQIVCKYPEYASKAQIEFIMNKWNTAEAVMYNNTATYAELDEHIDVESFAKMYLIQELTKNLDGGSTSYYVYYDGGKLHAGVAWDYDWTFGQYDQSGELSKSVANQTTGRFKNEVGSYLLNDEEGWWINSREIYPSTGKLNAQAALCQNSNFWSVVVAEWDELFYSEATKFADSTVSSVSELDGLMKDIYNMVSASTAMDEDKWGLIAKDLMAGQNGGEDWGSVDTSDSHDGAVKYLNNWFYNRLQWMDKYISRDGSEHTGNVYGVDYIIQPPTIKVDKKLYEAGDTVTLTIDDKTDGDYYYKIYKNGTMWQTSTTETYTFTADTKGTTEYTVYAVSNNSKKMSAASNVAAVNVDGFNFSLDVTAPKSVMVGDIIHIESKTNSEEEVTFNLYKGESLVGANKTGEFFIETFASDANTAPSYKLVATTTVDNELFTKEFDFTVTINPFEFNVKLTAPESVEAGMVVTLKANAVSNTTVKYKFFKADGTPVAENTAGTYSFDATRDDIGKTLSFYVVAATTVAGTEYTSTSPKVNIQVTEVKEVMDVTIYFKSTSTLGYRPIINTSGAVQNLVDYSMEKSELIASKNISQTSTFWWYKAEVQVSKASPSLSVNVLASRYAMEGDIILNITQPGAVYLGIDNLNTGSEMIDMTQWDEDARNWTKSAVHSIYDAEKDGKETLSALSANINLTSVGDVNGDGKVNIKDVTLIQKFLANLETLGAIGKEVSDVNSDSRVTIKDATAIQKKIAGCL